MKLLKILFCVLLSLSLAGCSVSKNPNPMIRYGANTAMVMATPGLIVATDGSGKLRTMDIHLLAIELVALSAAGVGYATGAVLGGTVGFVKWMVNGFENDDISGYGSLPESVMPPKESEDKSDE